MELVRFFGKGVIERIDYRVLFIREFDYKSEGGIRFLGINEILLFILMNVLV